jgi:U3 small nucleolar RNA-associated protein 5
LDSLLDAYQDSKISSISLSKWTRSILLYHSSSIMSNSKILQKLSPLYHSLNTRLETYNSLIDLSGRLDLVLGLSGQPMIGFDSSLDDVDTNIEDSTDDEPLQLENDLNMGERDDDDEELNIYDDYKEEGDDDDEESDGDDDEKGGFGDPNNESASDLEFPDEGEEAMDDYEE